MLSFLLAAVGCGFAALCYSELASMVPVAGSAYTYAYATLGELIAWIIGWDLILEYAIGSCAVANGWSNYFDSLLSERLPHPARSPAALRPLGLRPRPGGLRAQDWSRSPTGTLAMAWFNLPAVLITVVDHGRPGDRHQGERGVQRGDGAAQHRRRSSRSSAWGRPTSTRPTGTRSSTRRRAGAASPRAAADLLRLHRLRLDLDPRRGGPTTPARPGHRHHGRAGRSARCCTSRSRRC